MKTHKVVQSREDTGCSTDNAVLPKSLCSAPLSHKQAQVRSGLQNQKSLKFDKIALIEFVLVEEEREGGGREEEIKHAEKQP